MPEWLLDLLLPETDRGAVTQWIVAAVLWSVVLVGSRGLRREHRLFLAGLTVLTFAWFAARTVH